MLGDQIALFDTLKQQMGTIDGSLRNTRYHWL